LKKMKSFILMCTLCAFAIIGCRGAPEGSADPAAGVIPPGAGYSTGLESAPVTVVEFSDFGCPYCARFALNTYPDIHAEFVMSGRVRWIYLPFVMGTFPNGDAAARAAECAGDQERFWRMRDILYQRQAEWRRDSASDGLFQEFAGEAGLDGAAFQRCYAEDHPGQRIATSNRIARDLSIRATPTFLINGHPIEGALPPEHFRALLDWALEEARSPGTGSQSFRSP